MSVGVDIGSKTIKIVELSGGRGKWNLKSSGAIGHRGKSPEQAKDDKELAPLVEAIKRLYKEAKISSREVALAIPEQHVFTRTIRFPLLTEAEVASAVKWEAEQYIPIPINEAIVQHQVVERLEDSTPPQVVVLLIAVPKTIVEKYTRVAELSGIKPVAVESEMMAAVRSLAPVDQTVMIIDFGARSTDIGVAKNGVVIFSRTIHIAGEAFTRSVSQFLGISEAQAEEYKRAYGLSPSQLEGKIKGALDPVFRSVINEIKKAIHFYQAEEKGHSPQSIVLCGGSSIMPDIVSAFTEALNLEVIIGNPFGRVEVDPKAAKSLSGFAPLYSIAVGLAMREV